jgi:hypothetical protein
MIHPTILPSVLTRRATARRFERLVDPAYALKAGPDRNGDDTIVRGDE